MSLGAVHAEGELAQVVLFDLTVRHLGVLQPVVRHRPGVFVVLVPDNGKGEDVILCRSATETKGPASGLHSLAGKPAPSESLQNLPRLVTAYFTQQPDPDNAAHQVAFGTSGHRGSRGRAPNGQATWRRPAAAR